MKTWVILALLITIAPASAQEPRSIVGVWALSGQGCARGEGSLKIGALSLESEDVTCRFKSVSRKGNVVTWMGPCDDAEGSRMQSVTATERNGRFTIRYAPGGNVIEDLRRC